MPNRIIRESCRTSATLFRLSDGAERMFWRLITVADDFGRFESELRLLKAACFPMWDDRLKIDQVGAWYAEMETCELVQSYVVNGKPFGFFSTWEKYQDCRAKRSKHPDPTSANICEQMLANVPVSVSVSVSESVSESVSVNSPRPGKRPKPKLDFEPVAVDIASPRGEEPNGHHAKGTGLNPERLIDLFNELTPNETPAVITRSPERLRKAKQYLARFPDEAWWRRVFREVHHSEFLRGLRKRADGHESFTADFDWLLSKGKDGTENVVKVHDGRYSNGT